MLFIDILSLPRTYQSEKGFEQKFCRKTYGLLVQYSFSTSLKVFKIVKRTPQTCYLVYNFQIFIFTNLLCFTEHTGIIKISSYS